LSAAAKAGLKLILEKDSLFLDECLDSLNRGRVPDYVFSVILDLSSSNLIGRKEVILRLASGEKAGLALDFMKKLKNQDWLSEEERKDYLEKMIDHIDSTLRGQAMACWLGDDNFYNIRNNIQFS
jgi:hypothetical protein